MCQPKLVLPLTLLLLGAAHVASAATYYVAPLDPNCAPASPGGGTLANPWTNLYYASRHLACGDTLYLRKGTYRIDVSGYGNSPCQESEGNGGYALMYFTQQCSASNPITVQMYNGETAILDATSTQIDDASPASHWTRCESASQCGACTGLALKDYTRTYYSEAWNFSSADTEQVWIDPPCNKADDPACTNPGAGGTRLKWKESAGSCADLNLLDGSCDTSWTSPTCGSFNTRALTNAIVARLPDSVSNPDPDAHVVKVSCQGGTCADHPVEFSGASYINIVGGGKLYLKYGYFDIMAVNNAQHITIDGVNIGPAGGRDYGQCVRTTAANFFTIQNSSCGEVAAEGIGFYGGGNGSCIQIHDDAVIGTTVHDTGFASSSNAAGQVLDDGVIIKSCNNCTARGNTIYNNGRHGVQITSNWNGSATCNANNALIEGNTIYNTCTSVSQYMNSDCAAVHFGLGNNSTTGTINGAVVRNNVIRDQLGVKAGISPHGIKVDAGIGPTTIVNNSLQNVAQNCIDTNENRQGSGNFTVRNNVVYKCNVENIPGAAAVRLYGVGDWVHSNNDFWSDSNVTVVEVSNPATFIARDSVKGAFESTASEGNPRFTSATNLQPQAGSPLIDTGTSTSAPTVDIFGTTRPQGTSDDIGAVEYTSGSGPPAPSLVSVDVVP